MKWTPLNGNVLYRQIASIFRIPKLQTTTRYGICQNIHENKHSNNYISNFAIYTTVLFVILLFNFIIISPHNDICIYSFSIMKHKNLISLLVFIQIRKLEKVKQKIPNKSCLFFNRFWEPPTSRRQVKDLFHAYIPNIKTTTPLQAIVQCTAINLKYLMFLTKYVIIQTIPTFLIKTFKMQ